MGTVCCENNKDGLLLLEGPLSLNDSIFQIRKNVDEEFQKKRKASCVPRISIDGVSVCSSEVLSEIPDLNDQDTSLENSVQTDVEGRLDLSMLDVSSATTHQALRLLSFHTASIKQLHLNYFNSNGDSDGFDTESFKKLLSNCSNLEQLRVSNMFSISSAARHGLAQLITEAI